MSEPIRILQVGLTSNRGGVESFVMNLYRNIDRRKVQFDFLVDHDKVLPFEDEIIRLGGNIYHDYYYFRERKKEGAIKITDFFRRHTEIEGIHVHANNLNTLFRLLIQAKKQGIRLRILHSHNNGYMFKYNFKQKLYEIYIHLLGKPYVTKYLACSEEAGMWMFGKKTSFTVIPNSIDVEKFQYNVEKRRKMREQLHIQNYETVFGFVGSFNYQKDPKFCVSVFALYSKRDLSARMLMLGKGALFDEVQEEINKQNLQDKVICVGNQENVNDYMQAMDIFLLPSRFEGFGIVLLEAQAAGLPCITSDHVVPKSVNVTGNVSYISREKQASEWAEYIYNMKKDRYEAKDIILASDYCNEKLVNKIYTIYEVIGE